MGTVLWQRERREDDEEAVIGDGICAHAQGENFGALASPHIAATSARRRGDVQKELKENSPAGRSLRRLETLLTARAGVRLLLLLYLQHLACMTAAQRTMSASRQPDKFVNMNARKVRRACIFSLFTLLAAYESPHRDARPQPS